MTRSRPLLALCAMLAAGTMLSGCIGIFDEQPPRYNAPSGGKRKPALNPNGTGAGQEAPEREGAHVPQAQQQGAPALETLAAAGEPSPLYYLEQQQQLASAPAPLVEASPLGEGVSATEPFAQPEVSVAAPLEAPNMEAAVQQASSPLFSEPFSTPFTGEGGEKVQIEASAPTAPIAVEAPTVQEASQLALSSATEPSAENPYEYPVLSGVPAASDNMRQQMEQAQADAQAFSSQFQQQPVAQEPAPSPLAVASAPQPQPVNTAPLPGMQEPFADTEAAVRPYVQSAAPAYQSVTPAYEQPQAEVLAETDVQALLNATPALPAESASAPAPVVVQQGYATGYDASATYNAQPVTPSYYQQQPLPAYDPQQSVALSAAPPPQYQPAYQEVPAYNAQSVQDNSYNSYSTYQDSYAPVQPRSPQLVAPSAVSRQNGYLPQSRYADLRTRPQRYRDGGAAYGTDGNGN